MNGLLLILGVVLTFIGFWLFLGGIAVWSWLFWLVLRYRAIDRSNANRLSVLLVLIPVIGLLPAALTVSMRWDRKERIRILVATGTCTLFLLGATLLMLTSQLEISELISDFFIVSAMFVVPGVCIDGSVAAVLWLRGRIGPGTKSLPGAPSSNTSFDS